MRVAPNELKAMRTSGYHDPHRVTRRGLQPHSCASLYARITDASGRDVPDITTAPEMPEEPIAAVAPAPAADTNLQVVEGFASITNGP